MKMTFSPSEKVNQAWGLLTGNRAAIVLGAGIPFLVGSRMLGNRIGFQLANIGVVAVLAGALSGLYKFGIDLVSHKTHLASLKAFEELCRSMREEQKQLLKLTMDQLGPTIGKEDGKPRDELIARIASAPLEGMEKSLQREMKKLEEKTAEINSRMDVSLAIEAGFMGAALGLLPDGGNLPLFKGATIGVKAADLVLRIGLAVAAGAAGGCVLASEEKTVPPRKRFEAVAATAGIVGLSSLTYGSGWPVAAALAAVSAQSGYCADKIFRSNI